MLIGLLKLSKYVVLEKCAKHFDILNCFKEGKQESNMENTKKTLGRPIPHMGRHMRGARERSECTLASGSLVGA